MTGLIELFTHSPLFGVFSLPQLEKIAPRATRREVPAGTELVRQGDPGDALYVIESGVVAVSVRDAQNGSPLLVATLEAPDVFGELAVLTGRRQPAGCAAVEPSVVYRLGADVVMALAEQVPRFGIALARHVAERLGRAVAEREVPWVSLVGRKLDPRLWALVPDALLRRARIAPIELAGRTLTVAAVDPSDTAAVDTVARAVPGYRLKVVAVGADDWQRFVDPEGKGAPGRSVRPPSHETPAAQLTYIEDDEAWIARQAPATASVASGPQVVAHVDEIIATGLALTASDIHLEHDRRGVMVRYRVDGALQSRGAFLPSELGRPLVSRLKLLARMDITETRKPQDGRISVRAGTRVVDLRVSSMPSKLGEKMVLRILDAEASITDLRALFPVDRVRQVFNQMITRPQGLVLVSGPTGSGKTTTLYSALHARRRPELNVVTVEDPIEYHLDGVTQIQVQPDVGMTFAVVLRALLRQDPDVIMVGETRDLETARMAIEASMTGHAVFTSVHTNGALEAIVRLADLGIERYAIANSLVGVLHQRLVRRTCPACVEPFEYPEQIMELLQRSGALLPAERPALQRGRGCAACNGTGFKGRIALYELLVASDPVRDVISTTLDVNALRAAARTSGALIEMARYAGILVANGLTVPGEVLHLLQRVGA